MANEGWLPREEKGVHIEEQVRRTQTYQEEGANHHIDLL
jgi:hypothetical protein